MRKLESNAEFRQIVDGQDGFVLNVRTRSNGMIHLTRCGHLKEFTNNPSADFTHTPKFWSESKDELVAKAEKDGIRLVPCRDCGA